jgi:hypothetical protein
MAANPDRVDHASAKPAIIKNNVWTGQAKVSNASKNEGVCCRLTNRAIPISAVANAQNKISPAQAINSLTRTIRIGLIGNDASHPSVRCSFS